NGGEYDSKEARDHIERKYGHTKSFADSTEQFIEYTATESSLSGSPYRVRCQGREMLSARWLLDELAEYRANHRVDSENQ
ncbi:MAG: DUF5329 domain-containing protein, partial [Gammaproteobacteria bacterium]|nr:DUF5329 domain-containing protein [Gammaproteobacteria bacterium]